MKLSEFKVGDMVQHAEWRSREYGEVTYIGPEVSVIRRFNFTDGVGEASYFSYSEFNHYPPTSPKPKKTKTIELYQWLCKDHEDSYYLSWHSERSPDNWGVNVCKRLDYTKITIEVEE